MDWLSSGTTAFLAGLRANNDRGWFTAHREDYETCLKRPGERFAVALASELADRTGKLQKYRVFRMHRDVRIAKDKTPYNAQLHISFSPDDGCREGGPAWMFGLDPEGLTLGAGVFAFSASRLTGWRERCAGREATTVAGVLAKLELFGARIPKPELKRVPAPYSSESDSNLLLRRKGLTAWLDQPGADVAFGPDGPVRCAEKLMVLRPLFDLVSSLA